MSIFGALKGRTDPANRQSVVRNATRNKVDLLPLVPEQIGGPLKTFLNTLRTSMEQALSHRTPDYAVRESLFIRSPDGKVWEIQVDNAGVLTTVLQVDA